MAEPATSRASPLLETKLYVAALRRELVPRPRLPGAPEQSYGLRVVIGHTPTLATLYAHLDHEVASPPVFPGQVVRRGQVIGYIGMSGLTTGTHLHFEVRTAGQSQDPRHYLPR